MAESEAISCVVTDGTLFYGLRLAVTPEMKARVHVRDLAHPIIEGTGRQIKWEGLAQTSVPAKLKTHSRYASEDKITLDFVINLIYNEQLGGVLNILSETGIRTWENMDYLPVPLPEKTLPGMEIPKTKEMPQKVILSLLEFLFVERTYQSQIGNIGSQGMPAGQAQGANN